MSFFLKIGQTLAYFRREGKVPSVRDLLTMRVIGIVKKGENSAISSLLSIHEAKGNKLISEPPLLPVVRGT